MASNNSIKGPIQHQEKYGSYSCFQAATALELLSCELRSNGWTLCGACCFEMDYLQEIPRTVAAIKNPSLNIVYDKYNHEPVADPEKNSNGVESQLLLGIELRMTSSWLIV